MKCNRKLRVAVLFGGRSTEHEVSLQSARNVINAIDRNKYEPVLIGIDKDGTWRLADPSGWLHNADDPKRIALNATGDEVTLVCTPKGAALIRIVDGKPMATFDVAFPVLHGSFGEDGTIQGLLELADIPCVGSGVLGSALAMDKDVAKRLLAQAGLPVPAFRVMTATEAAPTTYPEACDQLGTPLFIKPANGGSSVGISKVHSEAEFNTALTEAFRYDAKVLVEQSIAGTELECSVLGNEDPIASIPGEVVPTNAEFYSYEAKYIDDDGAELRVPAQVSSAIAEQVRALAIQAFKACCCEGMARVDFFLQQDGQLFINEINTIPGFTRISMYPRLWEASGMPARQLVDRLIQLALDRFQRDRQRRTQHQSA